MIDLEELKKLALAATPGPWIVQTGCSWRRIGTQGGDGDVLRPVKHPHDGWPDLAGPMDNLQFIAAANPQTVLALIAELAAVRQELEEARKDAERLETWWANRNCLDEHGIDQEAHYSLDAWIEQIDRLSHLAKMPQ